MSIKKSLRIILTLILALLLITFCLIIFSYISNKIMKEKSDNLLQITTSSKNTLESIINTQDQEIKLLASQNTIYNFLLTNKAPRNTTISSYESLYQEVQKILVERETFYHTCSKISLYNKQKQVIACSTEDFVGDYYPASSTLSRIAKEETSIINIRTKLRYGEGNYPYVIELGCPIYDKNTSKLLGYIVSTISTSYLNSFLSSITLNQARYGMLLDREGSILYHSDKENIGKITSYEKLSSLINNYHNGLIEKDGFFPYTIDNTKQIIAYSILPGLDWVLLTRQDISKMDTFSNLAYLILFSSVFIILIVVSSIHYIFKKHYFSPIITLRNAMHKVTLNDLDAIGTIGADNELGELSENFNQMIGTIKNNYQDLNTMQQLLLKNEKELRTNYSQIEHLAYHDSLTNLANKSSFAQMISNILLNQQPSTMGHAVFFIDMDNFKSINDTLGHAYGDELIIQTGLRLASLLQKEDCLARANGDEFLLFKYGVNSKEEASLFAQKILETFQHSFSLMNETAYISSSIGIALYPENGLTQEALIKNADIAMSKSKETGKNKFMFFDELMEQELSRNSEILQILRKSIKNQELSVLYQPQVNIHTGQIVGYESLMRVNSKKLGLLSPSEFIPIAEESGLIVELGAWMLETACAFNKYLLDLGHPLQVAVNISTVQLSQPNFTTMVQDVLKKTKLPPHLLELEVTESTLLSSLLNASNLLTSFQELGVRISLDDFGTGYSSLNYLTSLPINTLKIDKSFIDKISHNDKDNYIAESIISLAHKLNVNVIAEGVENHNQLAILQDKNCDIVQGFFFSRPLDAATLATLLNKQSVNIKPHFFTQ